MDPRVTKIITRIQQDQSIPRSLITTLESNMCSIFSTISGEKLEAKNKTIILERLCKLSPKKTGTFLEVFNRYSNNLSKPVNVHHDAVKFDSSLVEIKTSRVYKDQKNESAKNLYEELINGVRVFTPFEELLDANYDCNIQQIKTDHFSTLNYCLFFEDVIIEFSIGANEIKNLNLSDKLKMLYQCLGKHSDQYFEKIAEEIKKLEKSGGYKQIGTLLETSKNSIMETILYESGVLLDIYKKTNLQYSDKQHQGNVGEGQFHINKGNILYHIASNYVCAHTYHDFVEVLKRSNNNHESNTGKSSPSFKAI